MFALSQKAMADVSAETRNPYFSGLASRHNRLVGNFRRVATP